VALWPAGAEPRFQCEIGPASRHGLGPPGPGLGLRPVTVEGGLGAHKWRDRGLIRRLGANLGEHEELLILDAEEVLETGAGNLFAFFEGTLVSPVADHRLLPGVTRARVIEIAGRAGSTVEERYLGLAELGGAQEVFVTSSLRGVVPVTVCGAIRWELGEKTRMLRAALAELWSTEQNGVTKEKGRGGTCIRSLGGQRVPATESASTPRFGRLATNYISSRNFHISPHVIFNQ
jgi:hypothetical protein